MGASDFAANMAQLRASARPQFVNFGGQMISQKSTVKDNSGAHEQMLKTIESFRQNLASRNSAFKTSQELLEEANMARSMVSQLDDDQRRAVMMDANAQKLRQRQSKLPGSQGMFVPAWQFYNDRTIPEEYLEYTQPVESKVAGKTQGTQIAQANANLESTQASTEATKAGTKNTEASTEYTKSATALNNIKKQLDEIDLKNYDEKTQLEIENAKATIDNIIQSTEASKSQQGINEAAAPLDRQYVQKQMEYIDAQIQHMNDSLLASLQEKGLETASANMKQLVNYGIENINRIVEKYAAYGQASDLFAADFANDMLSEINHIVMGASTSGLDTSYPIILKDGSQHTIDIPAALTDPTLQAVAATSFDEAYSAFVTLLDKSEMAGKSGYKENSQDLINIYDKACKSWAEIFSPVYYLESEGVMDQIPGLSSQIYTWAGVRDELEFMRYTIMHSGKIYDPNQIISSYSEEEKAAFLKEGQTLGKKWASNMPYKPTGYFKSLTPTQTVTQSLGRENYQIFLPGYEYPDYSGSAAADESTGGTVIRQKINQ